MSQNEGVVDFKVTIEEGRQFSIRSIKFDEQYVRKELHNLLLIRPGEVFNQLLPKRSISSTRLGCLK